MSALSVSAGPVAHTEGRCGLDSSRGACSARAEVRGQEAAAELRLALLAGPTQLSLEVSAPVTLDAAKIAATATRMTPNSPANQEPGSTDWPTRIGRLIASNRTMSAPSGSPARARSDRPRVARQVQSTVAEASRTVPIRNMRPTAPPIVLVPPFSQISKTFTIQNNPPVRAKILARVSGFTWAERCTPVTIDAVPHRNRRSAPDPAAQRQVARHDDAIVG